MACNVQNIKIEPCDVTYEIEEQTEVTCVADVASSLQNKYFLFNSGSNAGFYAWFNVATLGVDPAPPGKTGIAVAIAANASAATVASALAVAINANSNFIATADGAVVTITNEVAGDADDTVDFNTGFTFSQCQDGGSMDMGYMDGDIEVTFEETVLDITAHQDGVTPLTSLRQGLVNGIALTMKEADYDKYKSLMLATAGAALTPGGGTEVFGWGSASLGGNVIVKARRLVLHPVALDTSDKSRDLCFWKAYAQPDSLTISGENPKTLGLNFKVYKDPSKPSGIDQFVFKDWSQFVPTYP